MELLAAAQAASEYAPLVADPSTGFYTLGRRHCAQHGESSHGHSGDIGVVVTIVFPWR